MVVEAWKSSDVSQRFVAHDILVPEAGAMAAYLAGHPQLAALVPVAHATRVR